MNRTDKLDLISAAEAWRDECSSVVSVVLDSLYDLSHVDPEDVLDVAVALTTHVGYSYTAASLVDNLAGTERSEALFTTFKVLSVVCAELAEDVL